MDRPYPFSLDDAGVAWRATDEGLLIERRSNLRALLAPGVVTLLLAGGAAWMSMRGRDAWMLAYAAGAACALGWLAVSWRHRATLRAERQGVTWEQVRPHARSGAWQRAQLGGVRIVLIERPLARALPGSSAVQLRVDSEWVVIALGRSREKIAELGRALAHALELPIEETKTRTSLTLLKRGS
jgi:hypothetical protein